MQKPVGPLTSPVGAPSLLVVGGAAGSLNSLFLQLDQGLAKLFCKGHIISILGIAGHMVSATQFCSHRGEYINKCAWLCSSKTIDKTGEKPSLVLVYYLFTPRLDSWNECWGNGFM